MAKIYIYRDSDGEIVFSREKIPNLKFVGEYDEDENPWQRNRSQTSSSP